METLNLILTKFTDESITISSLVLLLLLGIIIVYWIYNRRKFHKLSHQIPASVVKNYLDSIIQNSTSLKSSLFRGGGLDLGEGIPAVVPVMDLPRSTVNSHGDFSQDLNQKNAEISTLKAQLDERDRIIVELEKRLQEAALSGDGGGGEELAIMQEELGKAQAKSHEKDDEIAELKKQLEAAAQGDSSGESSEELTNITKERDELKERLMEYEIIEEDLANLKRLQQDNAKLVEEVAALKAGGAAPTEAPAPPAEEPAAPVAEKPAAPAPSAEQSMADELMNAAAEAKPEESNIEEDIPTGDESSAEQKTADELLSEFEKMLG